MRKTRKYIHLLAVVAASAAMICGGSVVASADAESNTIVAAVGLEQDAGFDPCMGWHYRLMHDTLLLLTNDGNLQNSLATDYSVSEDGLVWTFSIQEGIQFSDGEVMTAADVAFTYNKTKELASEVDLSMMEEAVAVDDTTVEFHLNRVYFPFVYITTNLGIVPEHAWTDTESYSENPIGTGPLKLVQWDKGQQAILEVNENYHGKAPSVERVVLLFMDEETAFTSVKKGDVDIVFTTPALASQEVEGYSLVVLNSSDTYGITLPCVVSGEIDEEGNPYGDDVTADPAIRKAIAYGIDREKINEDVFNGYGRAVYSGWQDLAWDIPENYLPEEECGVEAAKQILAEGGWEDTDGDGIVEKDGKKAEFTIVYPSAQSVRQALAMSVAEQAREFGISIETAGQSWDELFKSWYSNAYTLGFGSTNPIETLFRVFYGGTVEGIEKSSSNYTTYVNPTVDQYLVEASQSASMDDVIELYKKAQWDGETGFSVCADAPYVAMVNHQHLFFVRDGLNIGTQPIQMHGPRFQVLNNVYDWAWE